MNKPAFVSKKVLNLVADIGIVLIFAFFTGCEQKPAPEIVPKAIEVPPRNVAPEKLALGKSVYLKYCHTCHGDDGVGTKDWRKRDANGKFPPPPLNGNGHTWHHSISTLKNQIYNGGKEFGGEMPAFGDKLNEQEIESVILWIQSLWPEKTYQAWYEMQHQ